MVLDKPKQPLQLRNVLKPKPGRGQLLVRISTCAVCRTDLHVVDGELPQPKLPLILGHQIVGRVEEIGEENSKFAIGDRVGIPWLGWTDGDCAYCRSGRENLCDNARFTGYTIDGGYAEFAVADARYCFHLPDRYNDVEVAPPALRRTDRLSVVSQNRRRASPRYLRVWQRCTSDRADCALRRTPTLRVYASRRQGNTAGRKRTGRGMGRRFSTRCRRKNSMPQLFSHPSVRSCQWRCTHSRKAASWCAAEFT